MSDDRQREALREILQEGGARQIMGPQVVNYVRAAAWFADHGVVHLPTLADTEGPWKATSPEANGWHYVWREGHNGATGPFSDKRTARLVAGLLNTVDREGEP